MQKTYAFVHAGSKWVSIANSSFKLSIGSVRAFCTGCMLPSILTTRVYGWFYFFCANSASHENKMPTPATFSTGGMQRYLQAEIGPAGLAHTQAGH